MKPIIVGMTLQEYAEFWNLALDEFGMLIEKNSLLDNYVFNTRFSNF